MWKGAFSPNLLKRRLIASFNAENAEIGTRDPDFVEGVLSVQFSPGGQIYRFPCTEQEYRDFEASGFDSAWLNENFAIDYKGDWGWPYGRTTQTGFAANT